MNKYSARLLSPSVVGDYFNMNSARLLSPSVVGDYFNMNSARDKRCAEFMLK
jgi:hypothetical protein